MAIKHPFTSLVTDIGGPTYVQPTHWNSGHNSPPFRVFQFPAMAMGGGTAGASIGIPSSASWGQLAAELVDGALVPAAGAQRSNFDFSFVDTIQLFAGRASNANTGAVTGGSVALCLQYMASGFPGSWYAFDSTAGSGPFVSMATGANATLFLASANGLMAGPSVAVSAAAKALPQPLTIRLAAKGGNGSAIFLTDAVVFGL